MLFGGMGLVWQCDGGPGFPPEVWDVGFPPPLGLVIEMQLGGTSRHLHKAASDYLVSASIPINFMWTELPTNSSFLPTDFLNAIGHGAVCDFMSAKSNPFHPCGCLFLRM